eukprot:1448657-Heterocapsa_arctica.AAC.1
MQAAQMAAEAARSAQEEEEEAVRHWQEHTRQRGEDRTKHSCIAGTCHLHLADTGLPRAMSHITKGDRIQGYNGEVAT